MVKTIYETRTLSKYPKLSELLKRMEKAEVGIARLNTRLVDHLEDSKALRVLKSSKKGIMQKIQKTMQENSMLHIPLSLTEVLKLETKKQKKVRHSISKTLPPIAGQWISARGLPKTHLAVVADFFEYCSEKPESEHIVLCKRGMSARVRKELGLVEEQEPAVEEEEGEILQDGGQESDDEDLPQGTLGEGIV